MSRNLFRTLVFAASLAALSAGSALAAADPFDTARWRLQAKQNAEALQIVDSGQFDVNMATDEGYTLLHYAAEAGNLEMVKALLARGADPTAKSNSGTTVYQMAIGTMVQAEIRKAMTIWNSGGRGPAAGPGAAPGPRPVAGGGTAGGNGMCDMARSDPANSGRSPALRPFMTAKDAVWYNHPDQLVGLLDDCVPVDQQDDYGWTLLHHAAQRDRVELARILLERGASRTLRDKDGKSAAHFATSPEMKALLGPASAARPAGGGGGEASADRKTHCRSLYEADAALASDTTGKMRAMRQWEQCLKTGRYW